MSKVEEKTTLSLDDKFKRYEKLMKHFNIIPSYIFSEFNWDNDESQSVFTEEREKEINDIFSRPVEKSSNDRTYHQDRADFYDTKNGSYEQHHSEIKQRLDSNKKLLKKQEEILVDWNNSYRKEGFKNVTKLFANDQDSYGDNDASLYSILEGIRSKLQKSSDKLSEEIDEIINPILLHKKSSAEGMMMNFLDRNQVSFMDKQTRRGIYENEADNIERLMALISYPCKSKTLNEPHYAFGHRESKRWENRKYVWNRIRGSKLEEKTYWDYVFFILDELEQVWRVCKDGYNRATEIIMDGNRSTCQHSNYIGELDAKSRAVGYTDLMNLWGHSDGTNRYENRGTISCKYDSESENALNEWYESAVK